MNRLARTAHSNHALVDLADSTYEHLSASNLSIPEGDEGASPGRDSSPACVPHLSFPLLPSVLAPDTLITVAVGLLLLLLLLFGS